MQTPFIRGAGCSYVGYSSDFASVDAFMATQVSSARISPIFFDLPLLGTQYLPLLGTQYLCSQKDITVPPGTGP
jgi:hypothetical protein